MSVIAHSWGFRSMILSLSVFLRSHLWLTGCFSLRLPKQALRVPRRSPFCWNGRGTQQWACCPRTNRYTQVSLQLLQTCLLLFVHSAKPFMFMNCFFSFLAPLFFFFFGSVILNSKNCLNNLNHLLVSVFLYDMFRVNFLAPPSSCFVHPHPASPASPPLDEWGSGNRSSPAWGRQVITQTILFLSCSQPLTSHDYSYPLVFTKIHFIYKIVCIVYVYKS